MEKSISNLTASAGSVIGMPADEAWMYAANLAVTHGDKVPVRQGGYAKELIAARLTINPHECVCYNSIRRMSASYAAAELLWYLSNRTDVKFLLPFAPSYGKFAEADGTAYGAYGGRMKGSLKSVCSLLYNSMSEGSNRRVFMPLYRYRDLIEQSENEIAIKDIPCTVGLQFLLSDHRLHVIGMMRSNDIWLGFPYDVFSFSTIGALVTEWVNWRLNRVAAFQKPLRMRYTAYSHFVGSMHLYDKDEERFKRPGDASESIININAADQVNSFRNEKLINTWIENRRKVGASQFEIDEIASVAANYVEKLSIDPSSALSPEALLFTVVDPNIYNLVAACTYRLLDKPYPFITRSHLADINEFRNYILTTDRLSWCYA